VVKAFQAGLRVEVGDAMPSGEYVRQTGEVRPLHGAIKKLGAGNPEEVAAAIEFVLEGLHLGKKLNKDVVSGQTRYRS
jgi:magnesium chelatase subunit I